MSELKKIEKPWGYEVILHQNPFYVIKNIYVLKGHRLSKQYHECKYESWIMPDGTMRHIRPKEIHRLEATDHDISVIEISSPHLDDLIRLEDDYNRVDKK